jgi:hypothetical protein
VAQRDEEQYSNEPENPFIGPVPYSRRAADAPRIFGRNREIDEVVAYIFSQPVVLIYSPSGAGKSSLMNAGVIPELEARGWQVLPVARVRGRGEIAQANQAESFYTFQAIISMAPDMDRHAASRWTLADYLASCPRAEDDGEPVPRVLVIDQFEEILAVYSARSYEHQKRFFKQLADAIAKDSRLRVVLLMREDRVTQLEAVSPALPGGLGLRYRLDHLTKDAAMEAVVKTANGSGKEFTERAAAEFVGQLLKTRAETRPGHFEEIDGTRVEPVQLQVICRSIWDGASPGQIDGADLERFGDIGQVLARYYDDAVAAAVSASDVFEPTLREWFSRRLITELKTRGTVFRGTRFTDEVIPIPNQAVDELEARHIIRAESRPEGAGQWYELVHDTFIQPVLDANEQWYRKREAATFAWLRIAAPPALVGLVITLSLVFIGLGSQRSDAGRPQFQGTIHTAGTVVQHKLHLDGRALTVVAVLAERGTVTDVSLRGKSGQVLDGRDLDPKSDYEAVWHNLSGGDYVMSVTGGGDTTYQGWIADGTVLSEPTSRQGNLHDDDGGHYLFVGSGRDVLVTAQSDDFDATLTISAVDYTHNAFNDDASDLDTSGTTSTGAAGALHLGVHDAALQFSTEKDQVYRISVDSYAGAHRGRFTLSVSEQKPPSSLTPQVRTVRRLDAAASAQFALPATANELAVSSNDGGDLRVVVKDPADRVLVDEDISPVDLAGLRVRVRPGLGRRVTVTNQGADATTVTLTATSGSTS